MLDDVAGDFGGGCGGEGQDGRVIEARLQPEQVSVGGPEIVSPLADAMGFVDGDQARFDAAEERAELSLDAFRGGVDELVLATHGACDAFAFFVRR